MQIAPMTQPMAMLRPSPLTAENNCPAMIHEMMPHPVCMMILSRQASFAGQYPMK